MDKNKMGLYVLYAVVIILLVYVAWTTRLFGIVKEKDAGTSKDGQWQAVFLSNGQVYFGKLSVGMGQYATLSNIYYLKVQQTVQPNGDTSQQQSQASLIKLGNELHKPMDSMKINKDQILFWENLKADGKVVQAIDKYVKDGAQATPSASPSATPQK